MLSSFRPSVLIALRFLCRRNRNGFISVINILAFIGIILSVAILIIVVSVMNGFRDDLLSRALSFNSHVTISFSPDATSGLPYKDDAKHTALISASLEASENVSHGYPIVSGHGFIISGEQTSGILLYGMSYADVFKRSAVDAVLPGCDAAYASGRSVIIGTGLATRLGISAGDIVRVFTPVVNSTMFGSIPKSKEYSVCGIADTGFSEYNNISLFGSDEYVSKLLGSSSHDIELILTDPDNLDAVKIALNDDISALISSGSIPNSYSNYAVYDWKMNNRSVVDALEVERDVMLIILSMLILLCGLNIISGLVMLVEVKQKAISILWVFGMQWRAILLIFIVCGAIIGVVGTAIGAALGSYIALNIDAIRLFLEGALGMKLFNPAVYFLSKLPSSLELDVVVMISCFSILVAILASVYPALRAARLDHIKILRGQ